MDIFGRDAHDYSHLRALDDAGILDEPRCRRSPRSPVSRRTTSAR